MFNLGDRVKINTTHEQANGVIGTIKQLYPLYAVIDGDDGEMYPWELGDLELIETKDNAPLPLPG